MTTVIAVNNLDAEDVQSEDAILTQDFTILSDPALWTVHETLREKLVRKLISQNIGDFSRSERVGKSQKRYLSPGIFERRLNNGETMRR